MGLVYAPGQPVGKGATSGNIKNFNPKLAGSGSRIGTIIAGAEFGYRFVKANYKFFTGLGAVVAGAGVGDLIAPRNEADNQLGEAYRANNSYKRSRRFRRKHCSCSRKASVRSKQSYRSRRRYRH